MIRRVLFLAIAALGAFLILKRLTRNTAAGSGSSRRTAPRFEGAMVRDRICSTFLPRSRALLVRDGGDEHFFCSEACREAFLSRHRLAR
jgi:YHS domain-containing protein